MHQYNPRNLYKFIVMGKQIFAQISTNYAIKVDMILQIKFKIELRA